MVHGRIWSLLLLSAMVGAGAHAVAAAPEAVPGEYVVKFKERANVSALSFSDVHAEEVRSVLPDQNIFVVKKSLLEREDFAINSLKALNNVEIVEPNYIYRINKLPNDPSLDMLWGIRNVGQEVDKKLGKAGVDVGAEQAWDITTGSDKIVVAVIDTGIDYSHGDIMDNMWVNLAEKNGKPGVDDDNNGVVDDIYGANFISGAAKPGDPMDDHGHGTHCSGTIAAAGNDGKGIVGVAWKAKLMGLKFLSAQGSGTLEDAIKAIDYAIKMKANVMSNSWGGGGKSETLQAAIERANKAGILFVAAAGNNSSNGDVNPHYPSSYENENVLAVAAIDNAGSLAWFSNYGKKTVHVAAPGENIYSSIPGNSYDSWSGTSMATPHVSGISVLMLANEPSLSPKQVIDRLVATSVPLAGVRSKVKSKGLVNAYYALTNTVPPPDLDDPFNWTNKPAQASTAHPYKENTDQTFELKVPGAASVSVYFKKFDVENGFDFVEFIDASGAVVGKWTGKHDEEFSPAVAGDTIKLRLKADHIVNSYGFDVSAIAYK